MQSWLPSRQEVQQSHDLDSLGFRDRFSESKPRESISKNLLILISFFFVFFPFENNIQIICGLMWVGEVQGEKQENRGKKKYHFSPSGVKQPLWTFSCVSFQSFFMPMFRI